MAKAKPAPQPKKKPPVKNGKCTDCGKPAAQCKC